MISSEQAIENAASYLKRIRPEYIGTIVDDSIRLETVQFFPNEWIVVLSYLTKKRRVGDIELNPFLDALSYQRYYKEFELRLTDGEVIAMRNPEAPSTVIQQSTQRNAS